MKITNQELIELSTKIEREGKVFYKELAQHVTEPDVKEFLLIMAAEEAQHETQFKIMLTEEGPDSFGWENDPSLRKLIDSQFQTDIFPSLEEVFEQLPNFQGIQKALDFALESEKTSAEFYGLLRDACDDIEIKTQLVRLEKAESEHLERVQSLVTRYTQETQ